MVPSHCGAQAPERMGSSSCSSQAQQLCTGLVALLRVESSRTRHPTRVPCTGRWVPNHCTTREILEQFLKLATYSMRQVHAKLLQLCLTLCDPMDCSLPGSSIHRILQARIWNGLLCPSPGNLSNSGIEPVSLVSPAWQADSLPRRSTNSNFG